MSKEAHTRPEETKNKRKKKRPRARALLSKFNFSQVGNFTSAIATLATKYVKGEAATMAVQDLSFFQHHNLAASQFNLNVRAI